MLPKLIIRVLSLQYDHVEMIIELYLMYFVFFFAVATYLSPVETHCNNVDYFIPDENNVTKGLSEDAMARLVTPFQQYH